MWALSTCGEPNEIKKNTHHLESITALFPGRHDVEDEGEDEEEEKEDAEQERDGRRHAEALAKSGKTTPVSGGQFHFVWLPAPARVPHVGPRHAW